MQACRKCRKNRTKDLPEGAILGKPGIAPLFLRPCTAFFCEPDGEMYLTASKNAVGGRVEAGRTGATVGRWGMPCQLPAAPRGRAEAIRQAAAKSKAKGRTNGRQHSEGAWSLNGRTRRESAGNRGSGQRGNKKAVKIFALWDAVKLFCAAGFCRKWTGEEPYPPYPRSSV